MVFDGGYHGGVFYFAGGGIPINVPYEYVAGALQRHRGDARADRSSTPTDLAAGHPGADAGQRRLHRRPTPEFLTMLREETTRAARC